tara:strand:+ start:126 stop:332 length:207 start_codon:yes stop_codon:yes gene_type:complete
MKKIKIKLSEKELLCLNEILLEKINKLNSINGYKVADVQVDTDSEIEKIERIRYNLCEEFTTQHYKRK